MQTANESAAPNSRELAVLKKYFPQCFGRDGEAFDMEKFSELLSRNEAGIKKEGFTLNFLGKSCAHYQTNLKVARTLRRSRTETPSIRL